jgi:hypothetical protein
VLVLVPVLLPEVPDVPPLLVLLSDNAWDAVDRDKSINAAMEAWRSNMVRDGWMNE